MDLQEDYTYKLINCIFTVGPLNLLMSTEFQWFLLAFSSFIEDKERFVMSSFDCSLQILSLIIIKDWENICVNTNKIYF